MTKNSAVLHYTNIDSSDFAPWCEFHPDSSPLEVGTKYRLTADLVEGDFYFQLAISADALISGDIKNLTFTNNSVDFVADQAYRVFATESKSGNYPFNVHIENLKLYKVIEN